MDNFIKDRGWGVTGRKRTTRRQYLTVMEETQKQRVINRTTYSRNEEQKGTNKWLMGSKEF